MIYPGSFCLVWKNNKFIPFKICNTNLFISQIKMSGKKKQTIYTICPSDCSLCIRSPSPINEHSQSQLALSLSLSICALYLLLIWIPTCIRFDLYAFIMWISHIIWLNCWFWLYMRCRYYEPFDLYNWEFFSRWFYRLVFCEYWCAVYL